MNEKNYYKEIIAEIKKIKESDLEQAVLILKKELSMPYIPEESQKEMKELFSEYSTIFDSKKITLTREEVLDEIQNGHSSGKQSLALTQVSQFNWVGFESKIQEIFNSQNVAKNAKTIFVESLIAQKLNYDFKVDEIIFNPSKIKSIFDSKFCIQNVIDLEKKQIDDLVVKKIALESFLIYLSFIFPKNINIKYVNLVDEMILTAQALLGEIEVIHDNPVATEIYETISKN